MSDNAAFLTRVVLRNYKSIAECDVQLRPLNFLVEPNGAGKSNLLGALRFVAGALRVSLDHALRDRGGLKEVRRRSGGHPTPFAMRLEFVLPSGARGHYTFRVTSAAYCWRWGSRSEYEAATISSPEREWWRF